MESFSILSLVTPEQPAGLSCCVGQPGVANKKRAGGQHRKSKTPMAPDHGLARRG